MRDSIAEGGGGVSDVAPLTTGVVTGVAVYSATFATLISNAWAPIQAGLGSMLAAAAPALLVSLLTAVVQREGTKRRSVAHYAIEEALEVTLEECYKTSPDSKLSQVVDPAALTAFLVRPSALPITPTDHAWRTLVALDDPLAGAASDYERSRVAFFEGISNARKTVAGLAVQEYTAAGGSTPPSAFRVFNSDALAMLLLYHKISSAAGLSILGEPTLARLTADSPDKEVKWGQTLVAQAPAADADSLRQAIGRCLSSPILQTQVEALERRHDATREGIRQLIREMEAIRRYRTLRDNTMWRRRRLKDL